MEKAFPTPSECSNASQIPPSKEKIMRIHIEMLDAQRVDSGAEVGVVFDEDGTSADLMLGPLTVQIPIEIARVLLEELKDIPTN